MPRDLVSLSIAALDETQRIYHLQKLMDVCLEQTINPSDDAIDKLSLLLDSYRASMDHHLHELQVILIQLRLLVCGIQEKT